MDHRLLGVPAAVVAALTLAAVQLTGQTQSSSTTGKTPRTAQTFAPARTADGQPDLQGYWTNATFTPLERPGQFAGKEFWTPEEAAAYEKQRVQQFNSQTADDIHNRALHAHRRGHDPL
jgi:hypothetical protein